MWHDLLIELAFVAVEYIKINNVSLYFKVIEDNTVH